MRNATVFTHFRCNQRCGHCTFRRADDERGFITRRAVEARILAALGEGATEIALSGGEPTMRGDLEELVAFAKSSGAARVVLETNATLVDTARATSLVAAGLDEARVNLAGPDASVDVITADEGGFEATLAGLRALASAGLRLSIQAAVVRASSARLPELPGMLAREFGGAIASLVLVVPIESPDPDELLDYATATSVVADVTEAARRAGLPVKLSPESAPPPCTFVEPARVAHLYSLTRGAASRPDRRRIEACAACAIADRCAGFPAPYLERHPEPTVTPIRDDRMRRRLSLITTLEDQIARELVTRDSYATVEDGLIEEDLIRVNFQCNQSCRFCFVSTHLPAAASAAVRDAIVAAGSAGRRITLSGGEPTLNAEIVDYVALAKASSAFPIRLQTNAIRLASASLTKSLVDAGMGEAFVSLHGSTAAIGDAVTHAPGTWVRTLLGIDNLVSHGVQVVLNFVICETNMLDLVPYVELVAARWPGTSVNISFVAPSTDVVPVERELIPRYADAMPHLARAIALASERGLKLVGFESMCGIPLCLVPVSLERYFGLAAVAPGYDRGEFLEAEACMKCDLRGRCYGVRRGYAELHGTSELRPVRARLA